MCFIDHFHLSWQLCLWFVVSQKLLNRTDRNMNGSTEGTLDITTEIPASSAFVAVNDTFISITIVVAIIGLVGNVLCIVVMLNKTMRHLPFAVFSGVLAVSDSCLLVERLIASVTKWKIGVSTNG